MRSSLGSLKAAWIWLVKAPGVKRPAIEEYPTYLDSGHQMVTLNLRSFLFIGAYLANLRTAL